VRPGKAQPHRGGDKERDDAKISGNQSEIHVGRAFTEVR
jgi:hypothetical protein